MYASLSYKKEGLAYATCAPKIMSISYKPGEYYYHHHLHTIGPDKIINAGFFCSCIIRSNENYYNYRKLN